MTTDQFFGQWNGRKCDYDHAYGCQCVDLVKQYCHDVLGVQAPGGNAIDYWTSYDSRHFRRIANTPAGLPQKGDILVWGSKIGVNGHTGVFSAGNLNSFTSFDQNWPLDTGCHYQYHTYTGLLGWLRPI